MRIAIMGTGAVGGYFGALLARAGHDVTFIARGEHLRAMQANGLKVVGPRGDLSPPRTVATDDPGSIKPVDVVLFAVKLYDTESAARKIAPLVAGGGVCISVQNGVDAQDRIAAVIGADKVMGGLAFVSGVIESPGVIRYQSEMSALRFGEADGSMSPRGLAFAKAAEEAGFKAELMPDIRAAQWQKFVGLATNAAMCCLVRKPVGVIYHDPDLVEVAKQAFAEVVAVAKAQNIPMPDGIAEGELRRHLNFPPGMYASMFYDLDRGRPIEVESFSGLISRLGRQLGVPTPVHSIAYACLKPHAQGRPAS